MLGFSWSFPECVFACGTSGYKNKKVCPHFQGKVRLKKKCKSLAVWDPHPIHPKLYFQKKREEGIIRLSGVGKRAIVGKPWTRPENQDSEHGERPWRLVHPSFIQHGDFQGAPTVPEALDSAWADNPMWKRIPVPGADNPMWKRKPLHHFPLRLSVIPAPITWPVYCVCLIAPLRL